MEVAPGVRAAVGRARGRGRVDEEEDGAGRVRVGVLPVHVDGGGEGEARAALFGGDVTHCVVCLCDYAGIVEVVGIPPEWVGMNLVVMVVWG